jgi:iron(III) transport system substrate-binding protein
MMYRFYTKQDENMVTKVIFWLLSIVIIIAGLTACSQGEPAAQAQSDEDSISACVTNPQCLVVYTAQGQEDYQRHLPLFEQQYPDIEVRVVYDSTGIITDKILSEKKNPQADVIWALATTSILRAAAEGILEPYAPVGLKHPDGTNRVHPRTRDSRDPPLFVGTDVFMSAFCVNTDLLAEHQLPMPTSWADLTDPVYKGHLIMPDPSSSGTGFIAVGAYMHLFGQENEEEAWNRLDALHENIVLYTTSGSQPCKLAAAGKIPIGISFGKKAVDLHADGAPVVAVFPAEGSGWELEANALIRKDEIKDAAKSFLDWAISDSAMQSYAHVFPLTAVETDVPFPEGYAPDPIGQLLEWRFVWLTANRDRILEEWEERYGDKSERVGAELPDALR